jgi:hypothetical protein
MEFSISAQPDKVNVFATAATNRVSGPFAYVYGV